MLPLPKLHIVPLLILSSFILTACTPIKPQPTPKPLPVKTPEPSTKQLKLGTFKAPKCSAKVAFNLLIDTSSSMAQDFTFDPSGGLIMHPNNRLVDFKRAANAFASILADSDVIGAQEFNGTPFASGDFGPNTRVVIPLKPWANNKNTFQRAINSLVAQGSTHTKDGFTLANKEINKVRNTYADYTWVLVFMSDGVPKDRAYLSDDPSTGLPDEAQNPTHDPNIVQTVKDNGVRIITIGVELDKMLPTTNIPYGKNLLKTIASSPTDYHEAINSSQLEDIYQKIAQEVCSAPKR